MGYALFVAQHGGMHPQAKPLRMKGGAVIEVVEDYDTDTYRVMYTTRFAHELYVLHAFQKKSKTGIKTPRGDLKVIESRLRLAADLHARRAAARRGD